jgi:hypothetical protein
LRVPSVIPAKFISLQDTVTASWRQSLRLQSVEFLRPRTLTKRGEAYMILNAISRFAAVERFSLAQIPTSAVMRASSSHERGVAPRIEEGKMMASKVFACLAMMACAATTAPAHAAAESNALGVSRGLLTLTGSWEVTIKPHDCVSGVEAPSEFWNFSYFTFNGSGTMLETTSNPRFQPGQRGPGQGYWERTRWNTYEAVSQAFIQFDTNPPATPPNPTYVRGSVRFEQVIEVTGVDAWRSTMDVRFRDANGNPVSQGCASAIATRMP